MPWYVIALGSALFVGLYDIAEKKVLTKENDHIFLLISSLIMLVFSLPLIFLGQVASIDFRVFLLIFLKCVFAVTLFIFTAKAIKHLEISEFGPLMNLGPLVLFIPSIFYLGERFTITSILGVLLIVFGTYVVELKDGWKSPFRQIWKNRYFHFILISLVFTALAATMDKIILGGEVNVTTFFFYNRVIIAGLLFASYFVLKQKTDRIHVTLKRSFWWILVAAVLFMFADYSYFSAVAIPAGLIALVIPLKRMSTLITTVLGGEMMKEDRLLRKSIACLIMIAGAALIVL